MLGDITPDWLRAAFAAEDSDLSVDDNVEMAPVTATSGEDGIYGLIEEGVSGATGPVKLFIKMLDLPPGKGGFFTHQQAREHHFYRVFGDLVAARVPRFYYGDYSDDFRSGILIIEALDEWEMGSAAAGINRTRGVAIARQLGLLNGSTLKSPLLEIESFLARYTPDSVIANQLAEGYGISLDRHRRSFEERLSQELLGLIASIRDRVVSVCVDVKSGDPSINQGDCRVDNMAFRHVDGGEEAALFDFGLTTIGDGMPDLSQCVTSAWSEATADDLFVVVESYHKALQESGPYERSLDETWDRFRRSMIFGLMARTFALRTFDSLDGLASGTPLERMRIHTWRNVMHHCEQLRIWELF
jgi:hypothetical protein